MTSPFQNHVPRWRDHQEDESDQLGPGCHNLRSMGIELKDPRMKNATFKSSSPQRVLVSRHSTADWVAPGSYDPSYKDRLDQFPGRKTAAFASGLVQRRSVGGAVSPDTTWSLETDAAAWGQVRLHAQ